MKTSTYLLLFLLCLLSRQQIVNAQVKRSDATVSKNTKAPLDNSYSASTYNLTNSNLNVGGVANYGDDDYFYIINGTHKLGFTIGTGNGINDGTFSMFNGVDNSTVFYGQKAIADMRFISQNTLSLFAGKRGRASGDKPDLGISQNGDVSIGPLFYYNNTTNRIGLGTISPTYTFDVHGTTALRGINVMTNGVGDNWFPNGNGNDYLSAKAIHLRDQNNVTKFLFDSTNGRVGIGNMLDNISSSNLDKYSMFVSKGILSENYAIGAQATWADYVFKTNYKKLALSEVEKYINQYKHLPGILSVQEVNKNGYSLHEMNVKLLEKIEELTLYQIAADKENKKQEAEIAELKNQLESYRQLAVEVQSLKAAISKNH